MLRHTPYAHFAAWLGAEGAREFLLGDEDMRGDLTLGDIMAR